MSKQYRVGNSFKLRADYGFALTSAIEHKRLKSQIDVTFASQNHKKNNVVVLGLLTFPMGEECGCDFRFNHSGGNKDEKTAWVRIVMCNECAYAHENLFSSDDETKTLQATGASGAKNQERSL